MGFERLVSLCGFGSVNLETIFGQRLSSAHQEVERKFDTDTITNLVSEMQFVLGKVCSLFRVITNVY